MKIDPRSLKELRTRQNWSIANLSNKAKGVSEATIMRIENDQTKRHSKATVERLARALKTDQETLCGEKALPERDNPTPERFDSQFRVRLSNQSRNALVFVASRYGVSPEHILEVAPLLFHMAAGESLMQRQIALSEVNERRNALQAGGSSLPHISDVLTYNLQADELAELEQRSIARNDIFGLKIDDDETGDDPRPYDYDHSSDNPFARFLSSKIEKISGLPRWQGAIDCIDEGDAGVYSICRPEIESYCGGDEHAAYLLADGLVGFHDIPAELRANSCTEDRNNWIKRVAEERIAALTGGLLLDLGI